MLQIIFFNLDNFGTVTPIGVPRTSNDHNSNTYLLPKGQGLFTSEKSDIDAYIRLCRPTSYQTFQNQTAHLYIGYQRIYLVTAIQAVLNSYLRYRMNILGVE